MSGGSATKKGPPKAGAAARKAVRAAKSVKSATARKPAAARKLVRTAKSASPRKTAGTGRAKPNAVKRPAVASRRLEPRRSAPASRTMAPTPGAVARVTLPPAPRNEERYAGLTEADMMRTPVSQYMNPAQIAFFRERLLAMRRDLIAKADATSEHLREHGVEPDPTDQATIEEEHALELRARDRERKLLKKIEQSLQRIEDGSYGYCEETGEAIGIPRLLARPTASLTIEAQSRRELKQKLYGD
jgi:DnaK suppressor protein